jgi:hypothetical protein
MVMIIILFLKTQFLFLDTLEKSGLTVPPWKTDVMADQYLTLDVLVTGD